jgi:hypothetical protein
MPTITLAVVNKNPALKKTFNSLFFNSFLIQIDDFPDDLGFENLISLLQDTAGD